MWLFKINERPPPVSFRVPTTLGLPLKFSLLVTNAYSGAFGQLIRSHPAT
jgi:hypothetical protein